MSEYLKLIRELSNKFPDYKVIVRPHPSEDVKNWRNLTHKINNVSISNKKPIGYWLQKSSLIIHTGCTTGIEGFILDKPVISFSPIDDKRFVIPLPDALSLNASSIKECINLVRNINNGNFDFHTYKINGNKILSKNIESLIGGFSFKKIFLELDQIQVSKNFSTNYSQYLIFIILSIQRIIDFAKHFLKKVDNHHNVNINADEIKESLKNLSKSTNFYKKIKIKKVANNLFFIQS